MSLKGKISLQKQHHYVNSTSPLVEWLFGLFPVFYKVKLFENEGTTHSAQGI